MQSSISLRGKVAIVIGSSSGIGAGIAELFSKHGARVCVTGRREDKLKEVAKKCQQASSDNVQAAIVTNYSMSKAALDSFTRCVSVTLAPKGIRVNSINPGFVPETDIFQPLGAEADTVIQTVTDTLVDKGLQPGTVEDIARVVAFVVSNAGSFMNGAITAVDGGFSNIS